MPDPTAVAKELETLSDHITRIARPLARRIDEVAFGGHPPRVVTFLKIDEAMHRGHRPGPHRAEMIENIKYADSLLFPEGEPADLDIDSFRLVDGVAQVIRKVARQITGTTGPDAENDAQDALEMSKMLAIQVLFAAWLLREQLLVVDLATALGADPIPMPSRLKGGGEA